jgi:hypothetical protein
VVKIDILQFRCSSNLGEEEEEERRRRRLLLSVILIILFKPTGRSPDDDSLFIF